MLAARARARPGRQAKTREAGEGFWTRRGLHQKARALPAKFGKLNRHPGGSKCAAAGQAAGWRAVSQHAAWLHQRRMARLTRAC